MWFETIKNYYQKGIYTDEHLETFLLSGMITQEQSDEIKSSK